RLAGLPPLTLCIEITCRGPVGLASLRMSPSLLPVVCDMSSEVQETRVMSSSSTDEIIRGMETLRSLDPGLQHFGARAHGYAFNSPLSEGEIAEVETQYRIVLPADYRSFLRDVGNGGAGPGYGVCKLGEADTGGGMVPWGREQDLSRPFPHSRPWSGSGYL